MLCLCRHSGQKGIFVAYNEMQARKLFEDFSFFLGEDVLFYPSKEITLYDVEAKSNDTVYQRLEVLDRICRGDYTLVITSVEALSHKLVHPELFNGSIIEINYNSRIDLEDLTRSLVMMAYERVESVEKRGQYAVRGGIIDVFSVDAEHAVRLELFGDEIDSIRQFDVNTQRSTGQIDSMRIIPAREIIYAPERKKEIIAAIEADLAQAGKKNHTLTQRVNGDIERLKESWYFPGIDRYIPYIADRLTL